MVGGLIQQQGVGLGEHEAAEHAAHLFAAGEHLGGLVYVIAAEEHTAQEAAQVGFGGIEGELGQPLDQVALETFEEAGVILGEIALGDGHAPLEVALVGVHFAHQNAHQRGDAGLVITHESDLVALLEGKAYVIQHLHAVDGLAQAVHGQNVLASLALGLEANEGILTGGRGNLLQLQAVQHLLTAGGLTALGLVGGEAADELLQVADLFFALLVLVAHEVLHHGGGLIPEVVVTGVHAAGLMVHVHDVGTYGVQEVTVMADHDDDRVAVYQEVFQPDGAFHIQTVGRLVQQDDGGMTEQRLRQQHLQLLTAVQAFHHIVVHFGGNADAVEQLRGFGFSVPATQFGKLALQLGGALAVLIAEVLLGIQGVLFLHDLIEALVAHDDRIHHGIGVVLEVVLLQHAHAVVLFHGHGAGGGLQFAADDAQQRGLARAVGADDAVAVVGLEDQVNVLVKQVAGKLEADVVKLKHGGSPLLRVMMGGYGGASGGQGQCPCTPYRDHFMVTEANFLCLRLNRRPPEVKQRPPARLREFFLG